MSIGPPDPDPGAPATPTEHAIRIYVEDSKYPDRVTHATGYAEVHRQLALELDALGVDVYLPPCTDALRACSSLPAPMKERLLGLAERGPCPDDVHTVYLQPATPDSFVRHPERFNVGLTMTERESLADYQRRFDWVGLCNTMDLLLTPTEWNRTVFERHGIRDPVVAPLGVDVGYFTPAPVRFLSVLAGFGRRGSRANWADIVGAFRAEFDGQDDVELTILSLLPRRSFEYATWREAARLFAGDLRSRWRELCTRGLPRVTLRSAGALTREQMRSLYREHDVYVAYSREGWGLPTLEAMACSLDVIACDYGAPMTYLRGSPARLFAAGRLSADNLAFEDGDLVGLRAHMRDVYVERRRMRRWSEPWSWRASVRALLELLEPRHARWLAARALRGHT